MKFLLPFIVCLSALAGGAGIGSASVGTYAWTVQGAIDLRGPWTPVTTVYSPLSACRIALGSTNSAAVVLNLYPSYYRTQFYRLKR